jgi:ferredoxin-type protein NapH
MKPAIDSQQLRKVVLAGVVVLMVGGALLDYTTGTCAAFGLSMLRFICPVGFVEISLATRSIVWTALPYTVLALGLVVLIGRFPCGWLCPVYKFKHKATRVVPIDRLQAASSRLPIQATWRDGVAVLVGVLAVSAITGYPVYCIVCPIGILSRNLIALGTHFTVHPDIVLLALYPLLLGIFVDWTRVCPVGGVGGIANQTAPLQPIQVDHDACMQCGECRVICPENIPLYEENVDLGSCTACLHCYDACPNDAVRLFGKWPRPRNSDT